MKILRYQDNSQAVHFGAQQPDGTVLQLEGTPLAGIRETGRPAQVSKILAPIVPFQILAIGLNYRRHAEETKARLPEFPVLFVKSPASLQNPGAPILLPRKLPSHEVDYECELAVVIGKTCRNVSRSQALDHVLGYTCANDVSARDWQKRWGGSQWCRGKSFDTFCQLGPVLVTTDEIPDPNTLTIRTILNGEVVQESNTGDMIFDVPTLIEFLSGSTTLPAGTVILTGTPHGVGMAANPPHWLKAGDDVTIEIDKIGKLTNPVADETY
jgi:2-keto-4-pentenoate hydratase/2-oxohepta-3-ene-1,7-dioic acid hydratase in catechol pathway